MSRLDTRSLVVGVLLGALLGGLLVGGFTGGNLGRPADDGARDPPAWSYSRSGPSCDSGPANDSGWVHVVASGTSWTTTLDVQVVHPRGTEVVANLTKHPPGTYEIALRTVEATETKQPPGDCQLSTRITLSAGLAEPRLDVTMNGHLVRSIDQDVTAPQLYPLPNPIDATG